MKKTKEQIIKELKEENKRLNDILYPKISEEEEERMKKRNDITREAKMLLENYLYRVFKMDSIYINDYTIEVRNRKEGERITMSWKSFLEHLRSIN